MPTLPIPYLRETILDPVSFLDMCTAGWFACSRHGKVITSMDRTFNNRIETYLLPSGTFFYPHQGFHLTYFIDKPEWERLYVSSVAQHRYVDTSGVSIKILFLPSAFLGCTPAPIL
jgi:hypothetical protein